MPITSTWRGLPEAFETAVDAALADAGFDQSQILIIPCPARSSDGLLAKCWPGGQRIHDGDYELTEADLATANSRNYRQFPKVAVHVGHSPELVAALLRHELEHVRQFQALNCAQALHDEAVKALQPLRAIPNSGKFYQLIPMERDANAAARNFVRQHYGSQRIERAFEQSPDYRNLLGPEDSSPGSLSSLGRRMRRFINDEIPRLLSEVT